MIDAQQQVFIDSVFGIVDEADISKLCRFDAVDITTGTTRTLTIPDADGKIFLTSGSQPMEGPLDMGGNNIVDGGAATFDDLTVLDWEQGTTRQLEWVRSDSVNNYLRVGNAIELGFIDSPTNPGTGTTYIRAIDGTNDSISIDAKGTGAVFINLHDGTGGLTVADGMANDIRLAIDFNATNPIVTSNSDTIEFGGNALTDVGRITTTSTTSSNHIKMARPGGTGVFVEIDATFNGFAGGSMRFTALDLYDGGLPATRDSSLTLFTVTDGVEFFGMVLDSSQDALFAHDVTLFDNLIVNAGNTANFGMTLKGAGSFGASVRGGTIVFDKNSFEDGDGHLFINGNDVLTFDNVIQTDGTQVGVAGISFADGSASFASGNFTIGSTGDVDIDGDLVVTGSITAGEYKGGSPVHLREDSITFGLNDEATISLGETGAGGNAWKFEVSGVGFQMLLKSQSTIVMEAEYSVEITAEAFTFQDLNGIAKFAIEEDAIEIFSDVPDEANTRFIIYNDQEDEGFLFNNDTSSTIIYGGDIIFDTVTQAANFPGGKVAVNGITRLGDGGITNYSEFETDGTLKFVGAATVWKDINLGAAVLSRPAASQPDEANFLDENGVDTGITTLAFAVGEKASGSLEMQHDYKEGSDFTFHIHWQGIAAPTGTDNVQWRLTYALSRDGTTLDAATVIDTVDTAIDTQYKSHRSDFTAIDGSTKGNNGSSVLIEDQLLFTIERVAATGDVYTGDALVATIGIHYEIDTIGSRQIITK